MMRSYELTNQIPTLLTAIVENIGEVKTAYQQMPSPKLRKKNRAMTIKATLAIEGNTLSEDQITAII